MQLVLSIFPGIDLLGRAFEEVWGDDICVVRGPDVIFGGDIRGWHVPAGRFQGVIGGPPCQCFSRLAHIVRHNGYQPKFGNLIPEFERIVMESAPDWFLMENVPDAPVPFSEPYAGLPPVACPYPFLYGMHWFVVNNRQFGESQNRERKITFGCRGKRRLLMLDVVALENPVFEYAACGGSNGRGGSSQQFKHGSKVNEGRLPWNAKSQSAYEHLCKTQGILPMDLPGWTVAGKCKAIGNGVPMAMGRALAKAVKEATEGGGT